VSSAVLFVDLDGTLLDVFERYHRLHSDLVFEVGGSTPRKRDEYLAFKRSGMSEGSIIEPCFDRPETARAYLALRDRLIETPRYLEYDAPFPWTSKTLQFLRRSCEVHLLTARRSRRLLDTQLERLGLDVLLDSVTTAPDGNKASAVEAHPAFDRHNVVIVGDTELDVATGRKLGVTVVAVTSGLRDEQFLRASGAKHVLSSIAGLTSLVSRSALLPYGS
jgi:phosphoglycolate phosphatase-like HAD superfamily hydrolase